MQSDFNFITYINETFNSSIYIFQYDGCVIVNCLFKDIGINSIGDGGGVNIIEVNQIPFYITNSNFINCRTTSAAIKTNSLATTFTHVCMYECYSYSQYDFLNVDMQQSSFTKIIYSTFVQNDYVDRSNQGCFAIKYGYSQLQCLNFSHLNSKDFIIQIIDPFFYIFSMNTIYGVSVIPDIVILPLQVHTELYVINTDFCNNTYEQSLISFTKFNKETKVIFDNCCFYNNKLSGYDVFNVFDFSRNQENVIFNITFINCVFDNMPPDDYIDYYINYYNCSTKNTNEFEFNNNAHFVNTYCQGKTVTKAYGCGQNKCFEIEECDPIYFEFKPDMPYYTTILWNDINMPTSFYFTASNIFSKSEPFSISQIFSKTNHFSESNDFSQSSKFTLSNDFSKSMKFTSSKEFSQSIKFTSSKDFSSSIKFSLSDCFSNSEIYTKLDKTIVFSSSKYFTKTNKFTNSHDFSDSEEFASLSEHTKEQSLTDFKQVSLSLVFTHSSTFTKTSLFTSSNSFTKSQTFSSVFTSLNSDIKITKSKSFMQSYISKKSVTFTLTKSVSLIYTNILLQNGEYTMILTQTFMFNQFPYIIQYITQTYVQVEIIYEVTNTKAKITQEQLIGIVCGSFAGFFAIASIILFIVRRKNAMHMVSDDFFTNESSDEQFETIQNTNERTISIIDTIESFSNIFS